MALVVTGCAAPELVQNDDLITGQWRVTDLVVAGTAIDLGQSNLVIDLSTAESSLRADTGCQRLFGSFTFTDDGIASFTVPGRSDNDCAATDQQIEDAFIGAVTAVRSWDQAEDRLTFRSDPQAESRIELTPAG